MKIGITGATGQLGNWVVQKLKERIGSEYLVALVRNPDKAKKLEIEVRPFDYNEEDGLEESLKGIDSLLLISGSEIGKRRIQHQNVIKAALLADVKRIVYTSLLHADKSSMSLASEHMATEELLKVCNIPYTILRNGWYTENYTSGLKHAVESGVMVSSAGKGKISSATREDYAEAAAVILTSEGYEGKVLELAGDESYTLNDLATEVSKQLGKEITHKNLPESEYAEILINSGLPRELAKSLASFDYCASKDELFDGDKVLSKILGRPTTSLREAVKTSIENHFVLL